MVHIFVETSKYFMIILALIYTFSSFFVLKTKNHKKGQKKFYALQQSSMFALHFVAYLELYLTTNNAQILVFYLTQVLVFVFILVSYQVFYPKASPQLLNNMVMLLMISEIMLTRLSFNKAIRQFVFVLLGTAAMMLIPFILSKLSVFRKLTWVYAGCGIAALLVVAILGATSYGAKLSISIAGISVQPSEFVKIIFVFFIASMLYKHANLLQLFITSCVSAVFVLVLVASKDLGSALLFFVTYLVLIYGASRKLRYFFGGYVLLGMGCFIGAYLFSHVQTRILAWRDPLVVYEKEGYQVAQSLFGIGTGGWFGLGLNQGLPNKIPVVEKDFMFSAIAEELGGIFALCLIMICISCFFMFLNLAMQMKDRFYKLVALGLGTTYIMQVFLTIGGATKFIPSTGVTLPLVSYGGSSLLSTMLVFGVIQALYMRPDDPVKEEVTVLPHPVLKKTEREFSVINYTFFALYVALMVYFVLFEVALCKPFVNSPYNPLQDLAAEHVVRGEIISSDGVVLASSKENADGTITRDYPYGDKFAHVVGFSTVGKSGLENQANFLLLQSHAFFVEKIQNDLSGEKSTGDNVVTTINYDLQMAAYEALGDYDGAVIVMEPSTGKILAMVSKPDFDPNKVTTDWEKITEEGSSVLVNRATQGQYAPGSVFKILTTLEYYRQNPSTYEQYQYECKGSYTYGDITIKCAKNQTHGSVDLEKSFAKSCNGSYANLANSLEAESFEKTLNELLFNQPLPINFEYNKSKASFKENDSAFMKMETAIGQGETVVSPLHMLLVASAIDHDGILMKPYLIDHTENYNGITVTKTYKQKYGRLMTAQEAELLASFMGTTVTEGTANKLSDKPYKAYGKTGTAQISDTSDLTNAWFVGYAQMEGYEDVAIAVIVENSGSGGSYAVPVAAKVFDAYFVAK